ncbi:restriction endonuclease subunit S [Flavobacterium sp. XS1P27]|uniref:restriction endonuclease subunit S n=1 Tax=Flavobacterium sp. XS1P27 TaxID=3401724 RepID=UPI003AAD89BF
MIEGYKDSPFGKIPNDWELVSIGEISKVTAGGTPNTQQSLYWGGDIPWMNSGEINLRKIKSVEGRITDMGLKNSSTKIIPINSVLMALAGQGKTRGKVAINEIPLCTNQSLATIYDFKNAHFDYIFQNLESRYSEIRKMSTGDGGRGGLNLAIIKSIKIPLPPLPEQQKIAEILRTVDDKIEVIDQQIIETQVLKKGLMQRLLTKGIGHAEFKDSPLGEIPKSWEVSYLQLHSDFITKGSTPTTYGYQWEESGIQFLRSECVSPRGFILSGAMFISEQANDALERSKIKGGDILMTITGNVGRVCIYPYEYVTGNINQHIARIRITDDSISSQFVFQFLSQSTQIQEYLKITTGQAYPQLSLKQVRETKIPVPTLGEQIKISEILSSVDEKLEVLSEKKTHYQELKEGLMQQLLTGKIRVKV